MGASSTNKWLQKAVKKMTYSFFKTTDADVIEILENAKSQRALIIKALREYVQNHNDWKKEEHPSKKDVIAKLQKAIEITSDGDNLEEANALIAEVEDALQFVSQEEHEEWLNELSTYVDATKLIELTHKIATRYLKK